MMQFQGVALLACIFALPIYSQDIVFGIKSCGSSSPGYCGSGTIPNSSEPTELFSFQPEGTNLVDHGTLTLGGSDLDADGLAYSRVHGLFAFELQKSADMVVASRLIEVDVGTASSTPIGATLADRNIRAAAFDCLERLCAIDVRSDELIVVSTATGQVVGVPVPLSRGGMPYDLGGRSDLAFDEKNVAYVVDGDRILLLAMSGKMTLESDVLPFDAAGLAMARRNPIRLVAYDISQEDDIYFAHVSSGYATSVVFHDILSYFNAGRGDLASAPRTRLAH